MKMSCFSIVLLVLTLSAQPPDTLWTRTYGGSSNDRGYSVGITSDGGYIITGETYSFGAGGYDLYLIKTDSLGNTIWTKTYGGSSNDYGYSVQRTTDGGYIIVGSTYSGSATTFDVYLLKTDSLGDSLWARTFGGPYSDYGHSVQETKDHGYIVTGAYAENGYTDVYLLKVDSLGNTQWTKRYDRTNYDAGASVKQTSDSGYIIAGTTKGSGYDVYLLKTDENGDTIWTRTFGTVYHDYSHQVYQTTDGGYIIVGWTDRTGNGQNDVYLIKTDSKGNATWIKQYGGPYPDLGYDVKQTQDGYIIAGATWPILVGDYDVYLLKINLSGDSLWAWLYPAIGKYRDKGYSIQLTDDGGYIVCGSTETFGSGSSDVYLIKFAAETGIFEKTKADIPKIRVVPTLFRDRITIDFATKMKFHRFNDLD